MRGAAQAREHRRDPSCAFAGAVDDEKCCRRKIFILTSNRTLEKN
jgi:hypothetical protein